MNQIASLEYLRVFAIICIVIDHYAGGTIGRYLGETFFCVFFVISSILFGLKWKIKNQPKYKLFSFLYPRIIRLSVAFYPFLAISILALIYFSEPITIPKIAMNLMYLSWFSKLPWLGHLWFLTMLIVCYVMFIVLSKIHTYLTFKVWILIIFFCLLLQCTIQQAGLPGYMFLILMYCGVVFVNADIFVEYIKSLKISHIIPFYIVVNILAIFLYTNGLFSYSPIISKWVGTICGFSNIILFINLLDGVKVFTAVSYLSAISYEVYLVHNPLIMIKANLLNLIPSQILSFIIYILISLICAWLLKQISNFLYVSFKKKELKTA